MSEIYSIRLSNEEKATLQGKAKKLGFRSATDFAKHLIQNGLESYELKKAEEHVLCNSAQSVMLLREVVSLISGNDAQSAQVIADVKLSANAWKDKFKKSIGE